MKPTRVLGATPLLLLLAACGGGGNVPQANPGTPSATSLVYTDPTSGSYQFKRNPSLSTKTHLVLELWGPVSTMGSGVTVTLNAEGSQVNWVNVNGSDAPGTYVANGTVFDLGAGTPILKATVKGNALVATVAEKGFALPKSLNGPLMRVALDLKSTTLSAGSAVNFTADATRSKVLLGDGTLAAMPIAVGSLTAQ